MAPERAALGCMALAALLSGCGVAGRPLPPGPAPPGGPIPHAISTPDGVRVTVTTPFDVRGRLIEDEVELWLFPAADCQGTPIARGDAATGVLIPPSHVGAPLRLVQVRAGRVGEPSGPFTAAWTAPPPAPEAPLAYVDAHGEVHLSWLPPEPPIQRVEIQRDGVPVAEVRAEHALWSERPKAAGRYRYRIVGVGFDLRTGPSDTVEVEVTADAPPPPCCEVDPDDMEIEGQLEQSPPQ